MTNKLCKIVVALIVAVVLVLFQPVRTLAVQEGAEHEVGHCIDIVDRGGQIISKICRQAIVGDEIITCDGEHYQVMRVEGNRAVARSLGQDKDYLAWCSYFKNTAIPVATSSWQNRPVGIYHTHSDESYLPSDGRSSIPFNGGIYKVGARFSEELKRHRVKKVEYDRTPHDPHDAMAYVRSRRTAVKLLKSRPVALFDVHRDGIPDPNFYWANISGEEVSRLRLVIGRQNPKKSANLDFAKRLMAYANQKYPKVVKDIFIGSGNYNQDLLSTALLIEAGTYTNYRENAEEGISLLADAVPVVLGLTAPNKGITGAESEGRYWWVLIVLLLVVAFGGGAFVLLNSGNSQEVLSNFRDRAAKAFKRVKRR